MAGLFKKIKKDYTLDPTKGSNKLLDAGKNLMDWKQVGEDARNIGFAGVDALGYLIPGGALVTAATGKTATDFIEGVGGKTYTNSDLGRGFAKFGDIAGGVMNASLPIATGMAGQAFGVPMPVGSAVGGVLSGAGKSLTGNMGGATQRFEQEDLKKQQQQEVYKFKSGGLNAHKTVINVEKGELLANPKTGEIVEHYNNVPKHPEGKHEIDLRGNVEAPVGYAVIPANMASQFKNAKPEERIKMIQTLPGFSGGKLQGGTNAVSLSEQVKFNPINDSYQDVTQEEFTALGGKPVNTQLGLQNYMAQSTPLTDAADVNSGAFRFAPTQTAATTSAGDSNMPYIVGGALAPQMGFGLYQTLAANKALKKLGKEPYAMYNEQVQPELQQAYGAAQGRANDASLRSRYGLSQAQQAMYNQNVARDINTRMQRAQDIGGGNVGQVVGNIMNANKIQAAQQQAALDAQMQMQKQQYADRAAQYAEGLAQRIAAARQGQQNQNTAFQQQLRLQKERAYGLAKQRGLENTMNAPMQAASILATYYGGK